MFGCGNSTDAGKIYGGHVYLRFPREQHGRVVFIVPLCPTHNRNRDMDYRKGADNWVYVKNGTRAVSKRMYGPLRLLRDRLSGARLDIREPDKPVDIQPIRNGIVRKRAYALKQSMFRFSTIPASSSLPH